MSWKRLRRRLRDPVVAAVARGVVRAIGWMSYRQLVWLARGAGALVNALPRFRRLTAENLRTAFPEWPEARVRATRRQVARHMCQTGLELAWFTRHPERASAHFTSVSPAVLEAGRRAASGQPMIMVTPHLGNWEMCAQYARLAAGVPLCAVARRLRNPGLDRLVNASRTRHGLELIAERGAMRHMLGALRAGKSLGILIDQNVLPEHGGEFVEFFGLPVPTTRAVAMLARRLGVEAACFACRREGTGFAMEMRALPKPVPAYGSDIELTQDLLRLNEDLIRTCPEQYMWFYERWRHLPPDVDAATRARFPSYARFHRSRRERAAAAATAATDPQAAAPPDRAAANMPPDSPLP